MKAKYNKRLMITGILLWLAVFAYRYFVIGNLIIGTQSYSDLNIANNIYKNNISYVNINAYHYLLSNLTNFLSSEIAIISLSLMSLIISFIILMKIFDKSKLGNSLKLYTILLMVFSPQFISLFTINIRLGFSLMLFLIGIYHFLIKTPEDSKITYSIGILAFILFCSIDFYYIFAVILFFIYMFLVKKKNIIVSFLLILITFIINFGNLLFNSGIPKFFNYTGPGYLINLISDLGGITGFGVFKIMLAFSGIILFWRRKSQIASLYVILGAFVLLGIYNMAFIAILYPLISFFAAYTINYYTKQKWDIDFLKSLTILVIICGLGFSFLSFFTRQIEVTPDEKFIETLTYLRTQPKGVIFSHFSNNAWIEYYSGMPTLYNENKNTEDFNSLANATEIVFYSRNLKNSEMVLQNYNVTYILITPEMKRGQVWSRANEGLLFLLGNKDIFRNKYNHNEYEVWEVIPIFNE